jgi:hypothetical protein
MTFLGLRKWKFNSAVSSEVENQTRNHMVFTSDERGKTSGQSPAPLIQKTSSIWDGHDEAVSETTLR